MKMKKEHTSWLEDFLENCRKSNRSEYTIINYRCDVLKYIRWFEHNYPNGQLLNRANVQTISKYHSFLKNLEEKDPHDHREFGIKNKFLRPLRPLKNIYRKVVSRFRKHKTTSQPTGSPILRHNAQELAVASRRRHLSAIKNFYEFLKQSNEDSNRLFTNNPVKSKIHGIRLKDEDTIPTKLLTVEDWLAIDNEATKIKERFIVHMLYYGGLRLSELTKLKLENFHVHNHSLRFTRKGGDVHTLFIQKPKVIFGLFNSYCKYLQKQKRFDGEHLFLNPQGKTLSSRSMYSIIMKIINSSACPSKGITPHSFRKACASNLYQKHKDLIFVRDYLNHADAKVTQTYIERLDKVFDNNSNGS
ncbi:MAG: tyrosine-type recombinase/integrase [Oligoflexia bacterium]|nr:tyrosine-type recombinase/integrase [Oligoflexia bacterium]